MNDNLLKDLNEKQRIAVTSTEGPLLIIAGAGSGKTKTIIHRIAYLIDQGIPPSAILAITFTNKAAEEMRMRIQKILSNFGLPISPSRAGKPSAPDGEIPFIGTFHSFCNKILRAEARRLGFTPYFTICDEDDSLSLIKEIQKNLEMNPKQFPAGTMAHAISRAKSELIGVEQYHESARGEFFPEKASIVYTEYQKRLFESNALDFDDLIMSVVVLFEKFPEVLEQYQNRYRYIHVDEYQDTNVAQYRFVRLLGGKRNNVAVVGDDAQSIYSFRHADYRNILNFEKDWPNASSVVLDQNYRSTQTILDAAGDIISKNTLQKKKRLWTKKEGGEKIIIAGLPDARAEADYIIQQIEGLREKHETPYKDCAILYRTNAQSRVIEEAFLENDIPYIMVGGVRFYARKEIKDIVAYFRFAMNEKDALSLKRIINVPPRKIGKQTLLKFLNATPLRENEGHAVSIFTNTINWLREEIKTFPPSTVIASFIKKIQYERYLEDGSKDPEARIENIKELITLASRYDTMEKPQGILKMLEDVALFSEAENAEGKKEGVYLMTLHAAKGLEFPVVFITGMEEGIFPHSRATLDPSALEEERRLCYVGLTRAKIRAYLLYAHRRMLFGSTQANLPSRFLSEISPERIERHSPDKNANEMEEYDPD
ncbi:MAG: UvrD-helicase domain-containing protein [Patescibacteria group bacterium]